MPSLNEIHATSLLLALKVADSGANASPDTPIMHLIFREKVVLRHDLPVSLAGRGKDILTGTLDDLVSALEMDG